MTTVSTCPICDNSSFNTFLNCKDYTVSQEHFEIKECNRCNFLLTSPRPSDRDIAKYYLSDSYISHSNKASTLLEKIYQISRTYTLNWKVSLLRKYSTKADPKKVLDYGCGTGEFLRACKKNNWLVSGVEPSQLARSQSTEITQATISATLEEINESNFDAITLWHVLEHVSNLNEIIEQLKVKLAPAGTLFIAVPNHNSWDSSHYKNHWAGYDVPRHLWHFSKANMEALLSKNGLKIVATIPMKLDAYYIGLLSEKYINGNKSTLSGLFKAVIKGLISNLNAKKTGEYSSLIYVIKK